MGVRRRKSKKGKMEICTDVFDNGLRALRDTQHVLSRMNGAVGTGKRSDQRGNEIVIDKLGHLHHH